MNIIQGKGVTEIPGLYNVDPTKGNLDWSNNSHVVQEQTAVNTSYTSHEANIQDKNTIIMLRGKSLLTDLMMEKESLDQNYMHSHRLLNLEIERVKRTGNEIKPQDQAIKQREKVYVSMKDQKQYNLLGRLLGPKGVTLKRIQAETQTKMSILGRGSMRDRNKEEELRSSTDPTHDHLKDDLHVLIEANPPHSHVKLAAGVAEIKKMMIPLEQGMEDLVVAKFIDPVMHQQPGFHGSPAYSGKGAVGREALLPSPRGENRNMRGGRGGGGGSRGGRGMGRGGNGRTMRGGRGGGSRDGRGGGGAVRPRPSSATYETPYNRHQEYPEHRATGGYGDYDSRGGYGDRGGSGTTEGSYGRAEPISSTVSESDPYYSSFSDTPSRSYSMSRDYNHGSGDVDSPASSWKTPSRRDYRHHPYQQSYGNY